LHEVWGYDFFGGTRTVDVHVRRLRAKLGPEYEALIGTVRNVGYKAVRPARGRAPIAGPEGADPVDDVDGADGANVVQGADVVHGVDGAGGLPDPLADPLRSQ
jgi:hypothetical protein